jgi:hypothetical protein
MKIYPKTYENIFRDKDKLTDETLAQFGSTVGSVDEYIKMCRDFYRQADVMVFDMVVRSVWLDQQYTFNGRRRMRRGLNGYKTDWLYGTFMKSVVGVSTKIVTKTLAFKSTASYLKELFPEFSKRNPFTDPEYYKFPFENVGLSQMAFVFQVHNRMEMLRYAEEHPMTYTEFVNWACNQVFCYNDEVGHAVYILSGMKDSSWPHIINSDIDARWKLLIMDFSDDLGGVKAPPLKRSTKYIDIPRWTDKKENQRLEQKFRSGKIMAKATKRAQ